MSNTNTAFWIGGLANKLQFLGSNTAETISAANSSGGWNGDATSSPQPTQAWVANGGISNNGAVTGIFEKNDYNGFSWQATEGHRTILLGY